MKGLPRGYTIFSADYMEERRDLPLKMGLVSGVHNDVLKAVTKPFR